MFPPSRTATFLLFILLITASKANTQETQRFNIKELDSINAISLIKQFRLPQLKSSKPAFTPSYRNPKQLLNYRSVNQKVKEAYPWKSLQQQTAACYDTSGRFILQNDTTVFYSGDPYQTADGNLLVSGQAVVNLPPYKSYGFLMKCNQDGSVLWTRTYDSANHIEYHYINYYKVMELQDGSILMAGSTFNYISHNNDLIITRTDNIGNIIWSKIYKSRFWGYGSGSADYYYVRQMKQDPYTGAIFLCGPLWAIGRTLIKLDQADGTIAWSKLYQNNYASFDQPFGIDIRSSELRYFGRSYIGNNTYVSVHHINKLTGDTLQTRYFKSADTSGYRVEFLDTDPLKLLNNGNYVLSGKCYGNSGWMWNGVTPLYQAAVLELDSNLNFVRAYSFRNNVESNSSNTRITVFPDGSGLFTMLKYISGYIADVYYIQFRNGQIIKQRKKHYLGEGIPWENNALKLPDGGDMTVRLLGDSITNRSKIEFLKFHLSDTSSSCLGVDDDATFIHPFSYIPYPLSLSLIDTNVFQENPNKTITSLNTVANNYPGCYQVSHCDSLKLIASDSILCLTQPLQITIQKNEGCGTIVPLTHYSNAISSINQLTDSTVNIQFNAPWSGYIYGNLQGCSLMQDSVYVQVLSAPGPVNLGADTALCPNNTLILNARSGYASYQWQDGSTDSLFTITQPGTYHIKVIDACNGVFYDTVLVSPKPAVPISIGPDRTKCNNDTIHLNAPSGFGSYSWAPGYNISSADSQNVVINPIVDTSYMIKAEKTPGCFSFDTVRITVHHSPPIQLGKDTSFCTGQFIILDAGAGFANYQWSTGSISQQITIPGVGIYSVIGTTAEGCPSFDTLNVLNVFPLPFVTLDSQSELCTGGTRLLDAGAFAAYRWHDGSISRTFKATGIGTYYVEVIDQNNCKGSDTTNITTILPLPKDFFAGDTTICSYGTIELKPLQSFSSYLWNSNSTQPAIIISRPGIYWLQVQDINNCTGRDSVNVFLKQCMKGLYVPTAFSPNHDGNNDQMRALLFGAVKKYEFTIYNRWGQVVYQTKEPAKGWNGKIGYKDQDTGVYAWTCRYQLTDEPERLEKGTFVLMR